MLMKHMPCHWAASASFNPFSALGTFFFLFFFLDFKLDANSALTSSSVICLSVDNSCRGALVILQIHICRIDNTKSDQNAVGLQRVHGCLHMAVMAIEAALSAITPFHYARQV